MFLYFLYLTSDSKCLIEDIILVDKSPKIIKALSIISNLIRQYLHRFRLTEPEVVTAGSVLWVSSDRNVVLPDPDGPITARSYPGLQYPLASVRMGLSLTVALSFFHVRVICSGMDIDIIIQRIVFRSENHNKINDN